MRRRRAAVALLDVPEKLIRFDAEEWIDRTEPVPDHWRDVRHWPDWHACRAWTRWSEARRAWAAEHGLTPLQWLRLEEEQRQ